MIRFSELFYPRGKVGRANREIGTIMSTYRFAEMTIIDDHGHEASNVVHFGKQRKPPVGMPSFCLLVLCCNFSVRAHFCERSRLRPFVL